MVVRITSPHSVKRALNYNEQKVIRGKAACIHAGNYILEPAQMNFYQKLLRMQDLNARNERTKKTNCLHISLNFHPSEKWGHEKLVSIANAYMEKIGFGAQPYLVYKHEDAGHPHLHIVTTTIQPDGRRINTFNIGKNQSAKARVELEKEFHLVRAAAIKQNFAPSNEMSPARYGQSETRQAITNVLNTVLDSFNYTTLPELNALLSLYNVRADGGKEGSITFRNKGLTYHLLDKKGNKTGVPVKASRIYNKPTLSLLEKKMQANQSTRNIARRKLKGSIDQVLARAPQNLEHFIVLLQGADIRAVVRKNEEGRSYGITFIDMRTKTVMKGSDVGKEYSIAALQNNWSRHKDDEQANTKTVHRQATATHDNDTPSQRQESSAHIHAGRTSGKIQAGSLLQDLTAVEKEHIKPPFQLTRKKRKKKKNV